VRPHGTTGTHAAEMGSHAEELPHLHTNVRNPPNGGLSKRGSDATTPTRPFRSADAQSWHASHISGGGEPCGTHGAKPADIAAGGQSHLICTLPNTNLPPPLVDRSTGQTALATASRPASYALKRVEPRPALSHRSEQEWAAALGRLASKTRIEFAERGATSSSGGLSVPWGGCTYQFQTFR